jgi:hypothetical protein
VQERSVHKEIRCIIKNHPLLCMRVVRIKATPSSLDGYPVTTPVTGTSTPLTFRKIIRVFWDVQCLGIALNACIVHVSYFCFLLDELKVKFVLVTFNSDYLFYVLKKDGIQYNVCYVSLQRAPLRQARSNAISYHKMPKESS